MLQRLAKRARESHDFLDDVLPVCLICTNEFSALPENIHAPVQSMKCGHSFCRSCILHQHACEFEKRQSARTVPCMVCRTKSAFVAERLHVNQSLIDMIASVKRGYRSIPASVEGAGSKVLHVEEILPIGRKAKTDVFLSSMERQRVSTESDMMFHTVVRSIPDICSEVTARESSNPPVGSKVRDVEDLIPIERKATTEPFSSLREERQAVLSSNVVVRRTPDTFSEVLPREFLNPIGGSRVLDVEQVRQIGWTVTPNLS